MKDTATPGAPRAPWPYMLPIPREYRSGLRLKHKALGGHSYVVGLDGCKPEPGLFAGGELPTIWRCVQCHLLIPAHLLTEGFFPRPCMGMVRAVAA